jgi:predicted nucleic acid-binding protein
MGSAVVDTSPLVFLSLIGRWGVLRRFGKVLVPGPVAEELAAGVSKDPKSQLLVREALERGELEVVEIEVPPTFLPELGRGERSALLVATRERGAILLTDDKKARKAARAFQNPVRSVPFLLAEAVLAGSSTLSELERDIEHLLALGYYLSPRVHREVFRAATRGSGTKP